MERTQTPDTEETQGMDSPFLTLSPCRMEGVLARMNTRQCLMIELGGMISKWLDLDGLRLRSVIFGKGTNIVRNHQ
jgi:hypothetical protein